MRQYRSAEPITVRTGADGNPRVFVWHGKVHRVDSVDEIREPRLDWWSASGEIHRVYYLVTTNRQLICDVYRDVPTGQWYLARTFD